MYALREDLLAGSGFPVDEDGRRAVGVKLRVFHKAAHLRGMPYHVLEGIARHMPLGVQFPAHLVFEALDMAGVLDDHAGSAVDIVAVGGDDIAEILLFFVLLAFSRPRELLLYRLDDARILQKGADAFHGGFAVGEHLLGRQIVFQYLALFVQRDGAVFQCVEHGAHAGVLGTFADDGVENAVGFVQHLYHAVRGNRMQYAMQSQFLCPLHSVTAANEHLHPLVPHLVTAFFDIVGVVDLMDGEAHPEVWGHRDHLGDMGRKGNHADVRVVLLCLGKKFNGITACYGCL